MNETQRDAYAAFASGRWRALVRSAVLLGADLHGAEDLAQNTLLRCYLKWPQVERATDRDAYVARVLLNLHRQARRRHWFKEVPTQALPDPPTPGTDAEELSDGTDLVRRALGSLTREQREVVVLRVHLQMPERETAAVLNIPTGTVKSRLSRALARLAADPDLIGVHHEPSERAIQDAEQDSNQGGK